MDTYNLRQAKNHLQFALIQFEKMDDTDSLGTVWAMLDALEELILDCECK